MFNLSRTRQLLIVLLVIIIAGVVVLFPSFTREHIPTVTTKIETKINRVYPVCVSSHFNGLPKNDLNIQLNLMKKAGVKWTRFDFTMDVIEPTQGNFEWGYYDSIVNTASSYGVSVIAIMDQYFTPSWANNSSNDLISPPPAVYQSFTHAVAAHYANKISLFEMGNEPNETGSWYPRWNAASYTAFLKAGYNGVKAANPHAKVLSGGLSNHDDTDADASGTVSFVQQMYANGAKGYFDYLALHPYSYTQSPDASSQDVAGFSVVAKVEAVMKQEGDANKQIMITEVGWPTTSNIGNGVTQANQAAYISRVYAKIMHEDYQYVALACIYDIRDNGTDKTSALDNFGLLTTDYTPKPSYTSVQKAGVDFSANFTQVSP